MTKKLSRNPNVSFVITAYNNRKIIGRCLDSVLSQSYSNFSIILVDDCSADGTPELVREEYKNVKILKKQAQSGPSISRNLGIDEARRHGAKFIAFLDSDVALERNWLKRLMGQAESDPNIGIIGGKLLLGSDHSKINSAGGGLTRYGVGYDRGFGQDRNKFSRPEDVLYLCSAAMLVRTDMLDNIGGFDESYFYGHEDADLGWRANLAGYRVVYNPSAIAYHNLNQTVKTMSDKVYFNATKNRIRSILKNYGLGNAILYLELNKLITLGLIIFSGKGRLARVKGLFWIVFHLGDTIRERHKVQATRKKTDHELFHLFSFLKSK